MAGILIAGAGAVGVAAAGLAGESAQIAVASRNAEGARTCRSGRGRRRSSRTVEVLTYEDAASREWDVVVLSVPPAEVDAEVLDFAAEHAGVVATMSKVPGDLELLGRRLPAAEAVLAAPSFFAWSRGPVTDAWAPGRALFELSGPDDAVARAAAAFGRAAKVVPIESGLARTAWTMPYMAELAAQDGDWGRLLQNLARPGAAAAEAVRSIDGEPHRPVPRAVAWCGLRLFGLMAPFDAPAYARSHFGHHAGQSLAMLDAWADRDAADHPALDDLRGALADKLGR
ncbi:NAD(P)-binding domain-containing protein [Gordonia sp. PP30]|uniref:NAD(P)-binding domain-containing protein n=1 Tax=Gordonia sp. PP30 TaxID=2935861 RepID=UPI001FFF863A|nr:NAD(P)-binding domain-containing protein [Gordonia sp. PP30]UQE74330.1 NAD(P)-binding domain-containing protein [Gordonia sp. PP30]